MAVYIDPKSKVPFKIEGFGTLFYHPMTASDQAEIADNPELQAELQTNKGIIVFAKKKVVGWDREEEYDKELLEGLGLAKLAELVTEMIGICEVSEEDAGN